MSLDLAGDLSIFTNPDEFGVFAVVGLPGNGTARVSGIASTSADMERPGSNSNSGRGSFLAGAADVRMARTQFLTAWAPVAAAVVECSLAIESGPYAGAYRVRDIERDGDMARFTLQKSP